jgi:uncharacterized protein
MKLEPPAVPGRPARRLGLSMLALGVYGGAALLSTVVIAARGENPLERAAWLPVGPLVGHVTSGCLGLVLAAFTAAATRQFVRRWEWARALHADLRPAVRGTSDVGIVLVAAASAAGEELFFRALLVPVIGVLVSSIAFGMMHQVRGRGRWAWASWAFVMGVLFAGLFLATGSLIGPLLAHAVINVANLRFLRDNPPDRPRSRRLGGLLGRAQT